VLEPIQRLLGLRATLAVIDAHGGTRLYIPKALAIDHPLIGLVGVDAASRLVTEWGGEELEVPLGIAQLTWYFARRYWIDGWGAADIRRLLLARHAIRVGERAIQRLVADIPPGLRRRLRRCRPWERRRAAAADRSPAAAGGRSAQGWLPGFEPGLEAFCDPGRRVP